MVETVRQGDFPETHDTDGRDVVVGDHLANGAIVLAVRESSRYTGDGRVFLALVHGGEYVTWIGRQDGTDTTWGHYFDQDLHKALADFDVR
jgi:hypothetical protein